MEGTVLGSYPLRIKMAFQETSPFEKRMNPLTKP
jgi:hypothetical protein